MDEVEDADAAAQVHEIEHAERATEAAQIEHCRLHEVQYTELLVLKYRNGGQHDEAGFFEDKLDTLRNSKEDMLGQMAANILPEAKYVAGLHKYLEKT